MRVVLYRVVCVLGVLPPANLSKSLGANKMWVVPLNQMWATHKRKQTWGYLASFLRGSFGWITRWTKIWSWYQIPGVPGKSKWSAILRCIHSSAGKSRWEKPYPGASPENSYKPTREATWYICQGQRTLILALHTTTRQVRTFLLPSPYLPPSILTAEKCAVTFWELQGAGIRKERAHGLLS